MRRANGQALVEFAILGSLALLALAFMIQIGLRQNYQQEIQQQTFRTALRVDPDSGRDEDMEPQAVQLQQFLDRQIPNPSQGFAVMSRTPTQSSASVTWGDRLTYLADDRDSQPRIIVRLNDRSTEFRSEDLLDDQPLVKQIDKTLSSTGTIKQQDDGSTSSEAVSTENTTMTFNARGAGTLSSSLASECQFEGDVWRCDR